MASFIQLMAILLGLSLLNDTPAVRLRPALRGGAAAGLVVLGVFGAFSIGAPLLLAGIVVLGVAVSTVTQAGGDGRSGGNWNGIVNRGFTWECAGGQVHFQ